MRKVGSGGPNSNMSLTYSDLPYYLLDPPENPQLAYLQNLPKISSLGLSTEFTVLEESHPPLAPNADGQCDEFIIIAEFSEIEGPIPLCTIPFDAPQRTDVNLNSLVVHLMSTDYQVNNIGMFNVTADTSVFRTNVYRDVHSFMQYFTLYDLKARGFVRPFCFGIVTKDQCKIDLKFRTFLAQFERISKVLKSANRKWFSLELQSYLSNLNRAKEKILFQNSADLQLMYEEGVFLLEDSEPPRQLVLNPNPKPSSSPEPDGDDPNFVSLKQIATQHNEIEEILRTILAINDDESTKAALTDNNEIIDYLQSNPGSLLSTLMEKLAISHPQEKLEFNPNLSMPLVHPLRKKKEPLRPLTTLGQFGSLILIVKLMKLMREMTPDVMFLEMSEMNEDFKGFWTKQKSFAELESSMSTVVSFATTISNSTPADFHKNTGNGVLSLSGGASEKEFEEKGEEEAQEAIEMNPATNDCSPEDVKLIESVEFHQILDKLAVSSPIVPPDARSGSFLSLSSMDEDLDPPRGSETENSSNYVSAENDNSSIYVSARGSIDSENPRGSPELSDAQGNLPEPEPDISDSENSPNTVNARPSISSTESQISISSYSSDEDISASLGQRERRRASLEITNEVEVIKKVAWWEYISTLPPNSIGLLKFFRRYTKSAHHILFSILLGRPVIISGREKYHSQISKILDALTPLVPSFPEKSWRLIRWHRGILIPAHFENSVKLIGLCIPERLAVHDLLSPSGINRVTILDVEKKSILGPAYAGQFLKGFEVGSSELFTDDQSLLAYIGSIMEEISSVLFMYKSLTNAGEGGRGFTSKETGKVAKKLGLKTSDIEIVRHLASIISEPEQSIELF